MVGEMVARAKWNATAPVWLFFQVCMLHSGLTNVGQLWKWRPFKHISHRGCFSKHGSLAISPALFCPSRSGGDCTLTEIVCIKLSFCWLLPVVPLDTLLNCSSSAGCSDRSRSTYCCRRFSGSSWWQRGLICGSCNHTVSISSPYRDLCCMLFTSLTLFAVKSPVNSPIRKKCHKAT